MRQRFFSIITVILAIDGLAVPTALAHVGTGIDVDRQGRIYFVDTSRNCIWRVDRDGIRKLIATDAHLNSLIVAENGDLYLVEEGVRKITPEGHIIEMLPPTEEKSGSSHPVTIDRQGNVYFTRESQLLKLTPDGKLSRLTRADRNQPESARSDSMLANLSFAAWGPDASLYIKVGPTIRRITPDGSIETVAGGEEIGFGDDEDPHITLERIVGLTADKQGNVYVANYATRRVVKITPDHTVTTLHVSTWPWTPVGVAVAGDSVYLLERVGNPYGPAAILSFGFLADLIGHPRVQRISVSGEVTTMTTVASGVAQTATGIGLGIVIVTLYAWRKNRGRSKS